MKHLDGEITSEAEEGKAGELPTEFNGFQIKSNAGSPTAVLTSNSSSGMAVRVLVNLNDCFMTDEMEDDDEPPAPEPSLTIELQKNKTVAVFHASIEEGSLLVNRVGLRDVSKSSSDDHETVYYTDASVLDEVCPPVWCLLCFRKKRAKEAEKRELCLNIYLSRRWCLDLNKPTLLPHRAYLKRPTIT